MSWQHEFPPSARRSKNEDAQNALAQEQAPVRPFVYSCPGNEEQFRWPMAPADRDHPCSWPGLEALVGKPFYFLFLFFFFSRPSRPSRGVVGTVRNRLWFQWVIEAVPSLSSFSRMAPESNGGLPLASPPTLPEVPGVSLTSH